MGILSESVDLHREALHFRSSSAAQCASRKNGLAIALYRHFDRTGDRSALTEAIDLARQLAQAKAHPDFISFLVNLANLLIGQFTEDGNLEALTESIVCFRQALERTPVGHHLRPGVLSNLGGALMTLHEHDGSADALAESVHFFKEAFELAHTNHMHRPVIVSEMSWLLLNEYHRSGNLLSVQKALRLADELLQLLPEGHLHRHNAHRAAAAVRLTDCILFDWDIALDHISKAILDDSAPSRMRLVKAEKILCALDQATAREQERYLRSTHAFDVYVDAVRLLPRVAHTGLGLPTRLKELTGFEELGRSAAIRAVALGKLTTAVELYEESKSVFLAASAPAPVERARLPPTRR
jgi:tetratricopeptide (TPR) repeat protein